VEVPHFTLNHYFEFAKTPSTNIEYIALLTLHNFRIAISVIIRWQLKPRLSLHTKPPHMFVSGTSLAIVKLYENTASRTALTYSPHVQPSRTALTNINWHNFSREKRNLYILEFRIV
jgi:hypothetical protein